MNWKVIRLIDAYIGIPLLYALAAFRTAFSRPSSERSSPVVKRILLVKFWGIGNIFMLLPSVASLRRSYPDAQIDLLTLESNREAAEFIRAFDALDTVNTGGVAVFIRTTKAMIAALRDRRYDVIIDYEQFARFSAICAALAGSPVAIGFKTAGQRRHILFTRSVPYDNEIHITRSYRSLTMAAGTAEATCVEWDPVLAALPGPKPSEKDARAELGIGKDPYVVFHVGTSGNFRERRWPAAEYAALADRLVEETGMRIVLTGLPEESFIAAEIIELSRCRERLTDACAKTSFREYFELLRSGRLVVSADTAAVHIASAVGTPVVGLYGPNTPQLYGPWGVNGAAVYRRLPCSPCITNFNAKTHTCRHPEGKGACMKRITANEVSAEIRKHFPGISRRKSGRDRLRSLGREGKGHE